MKIKDISLHDLEIGTNWRLSNSSEFKESGANAREWAIEVCTNPDKEDYIVYSAVYAMTNEQVKPLILIKRIEEIDFGGVYCEFVDGRWRVVGETANPNAIPGSEWIANPLQEDPSFTANDHDHRKEHHEQFQKWVVKIKK